MANANAVFGARVVGHESTSGYNARLTAYMVPATDAVALFPGDFVKKVEGGDVTSEGDYLPYVAQATNSGNLLGIVAGFDVVPSDLEIIYRKSLTERIVYIYDDPGVVFEIQITGAPDATWYEKNANIIVGTGNEVFGSSGMQLDGSTIGVEPTKQIRIIKVIPKVDNELGQYVKFLCKINLHQRREKTGV